MLCHIALCSPPYSTLTYALPEFFSASFWKIGLRVAVPLGSGSLRAGVILKLFSDGEKAALLGAEAGQHTLGTVDISRIKYVEWPLEIYPILTEEYLYIVDQLALRQYSSVGHILSAVLPIGLRSASRVRIRKVSDVEKGKKRHIEQYSLRDILEMSLTEKQKVLADLLEGKAEYFLTEERQEHNELCILCADPPWKLSPRAEKQREILNWLMQHGTVTHAVLKKAFPQSSAAINSLVKNNILEFQVPSEEQEEDYSNLMPPSEPAFQLTEEQNAALRDMCNQLDLLTQGKNSFVRLLYGITGSGKTAVYLELAYQCFLRGRSTVILAPEVAIAMKLKRDAEQRFPHIPIYFYHGYQTQTRRERTFRKLAAYSGPCLIIGTRSALFLPFPSLGAIILDEEHDTSFKQEDRFLYQAKEVAWERAGKSSSLLVLGSATPDIKTFYASEQGTIPMTRLSHRVGGGMLPEVELVDIKEQSSKQLLSKRAIDVLRETIKRGEQAVVLLNRRGYSTLMYCKDCGTVPKCPHCDISLTYHKRREQLVCHYCGYVRNYPSLCEKCGGMNFIPMGEGTEKIEEVLASGEFSASLAHSVNVLRLDRDSTNRPGKMEEILSAFAGQKAQILVGTQMLSKGHHFPNVTLALIADGDMGLNFPDYRAAERTFQLLVQSSGRSGRGEKKGRVLIQTRDTTHYCWQFVQKADYEGFYRKELELRRIRQYPPFIKLALVRFSFPVEKKEELGKVNAFVNCLKEFVRNRDMKILGPAPAPMARIQERLRFQCMIKSADWQSIRRCYAFAVKSCGGQKGDFRVSLDLDPVNML